MKKNFGCQLIDGDFYSHQRRTTTFKRHDILTFKHKTYVILEPDFNFLFCLLGVKVVIGRSLSKLDAIFGEWSGNKQLLVQINKISDWCRYNRHLTSNVGSKLN